MCRKAGFLDLLFCEDNTLKNRYMMVNPPEEWKMPETQQVSDKYRTSTPQVPLKFGYSNRQYEPIG